MSPGRTTLVIALEFPTFAGGIGTVAYEIARNWHEMGEHVIATAPYYGERDRGFDAAQGFRIVRVKEGTLKVGKLARRVRAVRGVIAEAHPDAIYAADWRAGLVGLIASGGKVPYVIMLHGSEFIPGSQTPFVRPIQIRVMNRARRLICNSSFTRDLAIRTGVDAARTGVVGVGSDPDQFVPIADRAAARERFSVDRHRVILTVARLGRRKGHETVLGAMPRIMRDVPDAIYLIAGVGPYKTRLQTLVSELNIGDRVRFLGEVAEQDLVALYNACDVFVLASHDDPREGVEGFGIVLLEAACCERPTIGARSGGIPEALDDGVTGILVDPASPEQTADAVVRILTQPELAARMGRAGRERVIEKLTWRIVAERSLAQLYGQPLVVM
jgi:phosphatidylinositol alpha-1,6-mannosyltransferase